MILKKIGVFILLYAISVAIILAGSPSKNVEEASEIELCQELKIDPNLPINISAEDSISKFRRVRSDELSNTIQIYRPKIIRYKDKYYKDKELSVEQDGNNIKISNTRNISVHTEIGFITISQFYPNVSLASSTSDYEIHLPQSAELKVNK